jgi:hemerythrin
MYQFTDDCLTGIAALDEEHRGMFRLINELQNLVEHPEQAGSMDCNVVAKNLLVKLREYVFTHFAHEESYMEQIGDPELARQRQEHAQFAEKIDSYSQVDISGDEGRRITLELLEYLVRWLYRHILSSDIMIGKMPSGKAREDAFAFADRYRTGITFVDEEHEKLFEIIRETDKVIHSELLHDKYDEITRILGELKDYTVFHFRDEEEYMEKIAYKDLAAQRRAHQAFVEKLEEINLDEVDNNQQSYLEELIQFLTGWLVNHILKMDKKIPQA